MNTYIAILRGINVTGHRKLLMAELRAALSKAGFQNVSTYIQSGNILFEHEAADQQALAQEISAVIEKQFGYNDVPVIVLTCKELGQIHSNNPFTNKRNEDIKFLHVTFLSESPAKEHLSTISTLTYPPEEFDISGKAIYLFCPNGYGSTKLNNNFFENKLKVTATTRNWKTVNKLLKLLNN